MQITILHFIKNKKKRNKNKLQYPWLFKINAATVDLLQSFSMSVKFILIISLQRYMMLNEKIYFRNIRTD